MMRWFPRASRLAPIVLLLFTTGAWGHGPLGRPGTPTRAECEAVRCAIVGEIDDACPCEVAVDNRGHVKCVSRVVKELLLSRGLPRACRRGIVRCARRSTCGRPDAVACRSVAPGDSARCRVRLSTELCDALGGMPATGTCCAACPTTTSTSSTTTSTSSTTTTSTDSITTTSTSSTTTTTLLPCGGLFPACLGSCPPGESCTAGVLFAPCVCVPTSP